jgi:RNA polymerase sigma factor (sigma-70 family)
MKKYNISNYIRYKNDVEKKTLVITEKEMENYTRRELVEKFMPLVENLAKKFSTSQQVCGILTINDLIQEGNASLVSAVNNLDYNSIRNSKHKEKTIKSFLSKRIKGGIKRAINYYKSGMKIPEYILEGIRNGKIDEKVALFVSTVFQSYEEVNKNETRQITDSPVYNETLFNIYFDSLLRKYLNETYYYIIKHSFGIDCKKLPAKQIANNLNFTTESGYAKVSQLKRDALNILIDRIKREEILDINNEKFLL